MTAMTPFPHRRSGNTHSAAPFASSSDTGHCDNSLVSHLDSPFAMEEATLRPPAEKRSHWSIAWSDLMMTMFILFLCLFVYQAAHKDFLINDDREVIAGDTRAALDLDEEMQGASLIDTTTVAPLIVSGTVRKVEPITLQEIDLDETFSGADMDKTIEELARQIPESASLAASRHTPAERSVAAGAAQAAAAESDAAESDAAVIEENDIALADDLSQSTAPQIAPETQQTAFLSPDIRQKPAASQEQGSAPRIAAREQMANETEGDRHSGVLPEQETVVGPAPLALTPVDTPGPGDQLFNLSRKALDTFELDGFAAVDLMPNSDVRFSLTGDLLFAPGEAALSQQAILALEKLATIIRRSSQRIHIEGHTDDIPIKGGKYANNWELSIARANAVASFLIVDMGMDPEQFVVSGYSSYKPVVPNTSATNRAANRRVEIVLTRPETGQDIAFSQTSNNAHRTL